MFKFIYNLFLNRLLFILSKKAISISKIAKHLEKDESFLTEKDIANYKRMLKTISGE